MPRLPHTRFVVAVSPPTIRGTYYVGVRAVTPSKKAKSRISSPVDGNMYAARVASVLHGLQSTDPSRVVTLLLEDDLAEHANHDVLKWEDQNWITSSGHPVACATKWRAILRHIRRRDVIFKHVSAATPADCRELARLREDLRSKVRPQRRWESRRAA
jgi:hypothetical protein